jgi:RHS repeat-associated protein
LTTASPDGWSRLVELEAWGSGSGGSGATARLNWLVTDQLGTPRMIFDQTGSLAGVKRHDYLPFGEEISAFGGRTTAQGYNLPDATRQKFTVKERDIETGLDYFGARYYASVQGRFTGVDPFDINYERQMTSDPEEADDLFRNYIEQPQHWNRYAYALNNPLRYVDPDGLLEYETELLGKKIKVKISDNLKSAEGKKLKGDDLKAAQDKIKNNIDGAIAKINSGADKLTSEQKTAINSMKGIEVRTDIGAPGMNTASKVFYLTPQFARTDSIDSLTAAIVHDSFHADQARRGVKSSGLEAEKQASAFALGVFDKIGITDANIIKNYQKDAREGHGPWGQKTRPPKKKTP